MRTESYTYSSHLPDGLLLDQGTGAGCGSHRIPDSPSGPSLEGEADTPIILPGPGELAYSSSELLPVLDFGTQGRTITWSYTDLSADVRLNPRTDEATDGCHPPD